MTLEQLRIFVAVAERLHVTRAAEALHLTQSAASAAIAALEQRHNTKLFDRVGRRLELTAAGRALLPEARIVLQSARNAEAALSDLSALKRGTLTVAASQTVSSYWLPERLARFTHSHPAIGLTMIAGNTVQTAQAVMDGTAELGFVEGEVRVPQLRHETVSTDRIAIYAGPDHPLTRKRVHADDLARAEWVLREEGSGTRAHFESEMRRMGIEPSGLRIVMVMPTNEAAMAAAAKGKMLTAVSELAAAPQIAAGIVVRLRFALAERRFEMLRHRERGLSRAAAAFAATLSVGLEPGGARA